MTTSDTPLLHTPLYAMHQSLAARMVPFAGYALPVHYDGVKAEHLHTRQHASLFDVSHMGQIQVRGPDAATRLESLMPVDLVNLPVNHQVYGVLTNDHGGIRDDLIISRWQEDSFMLVVNAACKQQDLRWLKDNLNDADPALNINMLEDQALLALQGPAAVAILATLIPELKALSFMQGLHCTLDNIDLWVSRSGYTGEDGVEISLPASAAIQFALRLLSFDSIKPAGLGARDTLRLEAGLCLYGHELNAQTSPVSAGLGWSLARARRTGGTRAGGFPGAQTILEQLTSGTPQQRVGLTVNGRAPVREGAALVDDAGNSIGHVSSGGFGPSVNAPIAMGYVPASQAAPGTTMFALVRDKPLPVTVSTLPFVVHRYHR